MLTPCIVPRGGFLYRMIVPGGGFLLPSSRVPGGGGWLWMKLVPAFYENDSIPNAIFFGVYTDNRDIQQK